MSSIAETTKKRYVEMEMMEKHNSTKKCDTNGKRESHALEERTARRMRIE